jgi:hypothetical protein
MKTYYLLKIKHHAMKTYWGSGGISLRVLNLALDGGEFQFHSPATLSQGKEPLVSIDYKAGMGPADGLDAVATRKVSLLCPCW